MNVENIDWSEHYIKQEDPNEVTYYIIRNIFSNAGLFCCYNFFAGRIKYALSKGYIPVIDMQNYPNPYLPAERIGKENAWEYYFYQPLRIGLEIAYKGANILLSDGQPLPYPQRPHGEVSGSYDNNSKFLTEWRMMVKLGLLKIKSNIEEEINKIYKELFTPNDRVLGVYLRGTDYVAFKPKGHYITPPLEYAMSHVLLKFNELKCNKVFLVTEDKNILESFKQVFGDKCLTTNKTYVNYDGRRTIGYYHASRENDHYLRGKEYLIDIKILSKLKYMVAARTNGSIGAMIMAEDGFDEVMTFNLGKYGMITPEDLR